MKKCIILILVLLVVGLGGYVVYDKVLEKDDKETKDEVKKDNKKDIKLNENKDYVYDAVYNTDSKYDDFEMPYININSQDATNVNNELKKLYNSYIDDYDKCLIESSNCQMELDYEGYDNNKNVISVVIEYSNNNDTTYLIYNFDKKTGNLVSNEDLLKNVNLTMSEVKTKVINDIKTYDTIDKEAFENIKYTQDNINAGLKYFEQTSEDKMLLFLENDKLNIITKIYTDTNNDGLFETITIN